VLPDPVRRLGPVYHKLDQLVDVQYGKCGLLQRCHARLHDVHDRRGDAPVHQEWQPPLGQPRYNERASWRLSTTLDPLRRPGDRLGPILTGEVVFYFLKDGTAPMSPAPTSRTLTVGKKVVTLKSDGDGLVSPIGPRILPIGAILDGVLSLELDVKALSVPLGLR
jgi:hypothetical protein